MESDLVRDSKLDTRFESDYTVHTYHQHGLNYHRRPVQREEFWRRERQLGSGAFGIVWLEKCVLDQENVRLRAVKQILKRRLRGVPQLDYARELEAIAKFSHPKVSETA
jgi:hypothetical protein